MRFGQRNRFGAAIAALAVWAVCLSARAEKSEIQPPVTERFAAGDVEETPSFQKHVVPLFGRLGCNGRACHGSFQGRGGFRLSLFGYDFKADHDALLDEDNPRVDRDDPPYSLIVFKPTDADEHEGGLRYEKGGWEHHVIQKWIEAGAEFEQSSVEKLVELRIEPSELQFRQEGQQVQLRAVAVWRDGTREDVTPLCRFQTNDDLMAKIDENGLVTSGEAGDTHVVVSYDKAVVPVPVIRPVTNLAGDAYPKVETPTKVDELVVQKLRKLGVVPSDVASDAEFLRRVRLDLTASLPLPQEIEAFLADKSPDKRAKKIDELLETTGYTAWWTTRLCDFTGNNDDQLVNTSPMRGASGQEWYDWIYKRVAENVPYDELVAGIVTAESRRPGQSYREYCEEMSDLYRDDSEGSFADRPSMPHYWARRDLRQPPERAINFSYAFMGVRIQCAQCHKHPFDQWSKNDFEQFTQFFTGVVAANNGRDRDEYNKMVKELGLEGKRGGQLRRELPALLREGKTVPFPEVYARPARRSNNNRGNNRRRNNQSTSTSATLLGSDEVDLTEFDDARQALMQWLRDKENPYFAKAFVNRVWATYFNAGIVNPPDDLSLANPPSNKPLLDYLAQGFIDSGFDMKWVHREILNSQAYQRSWQPNETNAADTRNFSHAIVRRLPAEVVYDAVQQATASDEELKRLHEELEGRAIGIASASARYRNNRDPATYALTVFGRSTRESSCDCDRSMEASLLQTVFLRNDRDMLGLIDRQLSDRRAKPGWLAQIADAFEPEEPARQANRQEVPPNVKKRLASLRNQLNKARENDNEQQVKRLKTQLASVQKRIQQAQADRQPEPEPQKVEAKDVEADELVRQAYLRTLSRYPTDDELAVSRKYVEGDEDVINGARGLMWALLNTKEFIVNH